MTPDPFDALYKKTGPGDEDWEADNAIAGDNVLGVGWLEKTTWDMK